MAQQELCVVNDFVVSWLSQLGSLSSLTHRRQRLVTMAIGLTAGTSLAPDIYERALLAQFVKGTLSIEQMQDCLSAREQMQVLSNEKH